MRFSNSFQNTFTKLIFLGAVFVFLGIPTQTVAAQENSTKISQASLIPEAEKLLVDLGYWIIFVDRKKDASTSHAITAFQKVEGRRRTGVLTQKELDAMRLASRPAAKRAGAAHVEVGNARQVLFRVVKTGTSRAFFPFQPERVKSITVKENSKRRIRRAAITKLHARLPALGTRRSGTFTTRIIF